MFEKVKSTPADEETFSLLAKYLCIVVSGFLETSVREIYDDYAQNKAHRNVSGYVSKQLRRFHNPKMNNILALAESFCPRWKEEMERVVGTEIVDAVNSVVNIRNNIAHGVNVGITLGRIKEYYVKVVELITLIERQCTSSERSPGKSII